MAARPPIRFAAFVFLGITSLSSGCSCHRRGIATGNASDTDAAAAGAGAADAATFDAGARDTAFDTVPLVDCGVGDGGAGVSVTGRVVVGGDACRGVTSDAIVTFTPVADRAYPAGGASVPCGSPFQVELPPGRYTVNYKIQGREFYLDAKLPEPIIVGAVATALGDLSLPAHRLSGRFTVNGQRPVPVPTTTTDPCAHFTFRSVGGNWGAAIAYVSCASAEFTVVLPPDRYDQSYQGLEAVYPAELAGPALPPSAWPLASGWLNQADRSDWVIDLPLVRLSGRIVFDPPLPGLGPLPCQRPRTSGGAALQLEIADHGSWLDVCGGIFDAYVFAGPFQSSLGFTDAEGSEASFQLPPMTVTADTRDVQLTVRPVTLRARLMGHGRPIDLPDGSHTRVLAFAGNRPFASAVTVRGGAATSFTAILERAAYEVSAHSTKDDLAPFPLQATLARIDLTGAPATLDQDLELDVYRVAGRVTVAGAAVPDCATVVRRVQFGSEASGLSLLAPVCGAQGLTFVGWARPGRHPVALEERDTYRSVRVGEVAIDRHRDDLVFDLTAADWQRWRAEKPAVCPR